MILTPPNRWVFFLLLNCAWFGIYFGVVEFFQTTLERGDYSHASDSIGIPIMAWTGILVLGAPVVNLVAAVLLMGAKFPAPLNANNDKRKYLNFFLTALAVFTTIAIAGLLIGILVEGVPLFTLYEAPSALIAISLCVNMPETTYSGKFRVTPLFCLGQ